MKERLTDINEVYQTKPAFCCFTDMKTYTLRTEQQLNVPVDEAWEFLSTPRNLTDITPPQMNFKILSVDDDRSTYAGQIIAYTIQLFPLVKFRWVTEITHVSKPNYFVDEQRFGPYKFWHHQHILEPNKDGVKMTDIVTYGLPLGFLGRFMNKIYIRKQLRDIFEYRKKAVDTLMNKKGKAEGELKVA